MPPWGGPTSVLLAGSCRRATPRRQSGQVYQLLHELERRGLVARRDVTVGTRVRRVFRLTARGDRALATWLGRRPSWPPPLREEIIVRLLAAERTGTAAVLGQLERQEAEYRRYVSLVEEEAARAGGSVTRRLAHEAVLRQAETHLRWLAHCRETLATRDISGRGPERGCGDSSRAGVVLSSPGSGS